MVDNKSSRTCWAYETTPGTTEITLATSPSYLFGEYDAKAKQMSVNSINNQIGSYSTYNSRVVTLTDLLRDFPTFKHSYNPVTPHFLLEILGKVTAAAPNTIDVLEIGKTQYPKSIRFEHKEGTNPHLFQMIGAYTISSIIEIAVNNPVLVTQEYAYQSIADQNDYPILTTSPMKAGVVNNPYCGQPEVIYDKGGGGEATLSNIHTALININQNYSATLAQGGLTQRVYKENYKPIDLRLVGILQDNENWDDIIERNAKDYEIGMYKSNSTYYLKILLENCRVINEVKTGQVFKGYYESVLMLQAEIPSGDFVFDGANFATHFKGEVV